MKGVVIEKAGAEPEVTDSLEKPKPSSDQILVKSIYMAINPVDSYMISSGLLVTAWPFVFGCDGAGVVVEVGDKAGSKFKIGDEVCGCTRLGIPGHSPAQEYFLMDAALTMLKPKNVSLQQAATLGVGTYTAALGLFNGLNVPIPDLDNLPEDKSDDESEPLSKSPSPEKEEKTKEDTDKSDAGDQTKTDAPKQSDQTDSEAKKVKEWVVVLGGATSVGKYGIQIAKAAGFNVAASCSASSAEMVKDLGAVPFDYKRSLEHQVKEVMSITSNKPFRILDAAATGDALAKEVFKRLSEGQKLLATTGNFDLTDIEGGKGYVIQLGPIGRPEAADLNADIEKFVPLIEGLVEKDRIIPNPYDIVGEGGFKDVIEALRYQQKGAGGSNKVVVKIQDP